MRTKHKAILAVVATLIAAIAFVLWAQSAQFPILQPKGEIAQRQRDLLLFAGGLSLFVVVPVFAMTFHIARTYREGNKKAEYKPDWDHNAKLETIWWGIPILLISILAVITWVTSHSLDPYKPLTSDKKPLTVQVIALEWKWLFIYPEQNIATVNYLQVPEDTPINFQITADAPMNSFWIPQLGGQVYAMAGMNTKLHLIANERGVYKGSSANLSGKGFAGMKFNVKATSAGEFNEWVKIVKQANNGLTLDAYNELAKQSENNPVTLFSWKEPDLYDTVINKYMAHTAEAEGGHDMSTMRTGQEMQHE